MPDALIGHTGFVGGNLAAQHRFDAGYHSKTIADIAGRAFDTLVVSAMPAAMWVANRDPVADREILDGLLGHIRQVRAVRVVVMSTVAVYPDPIGVDEDSPIDSAAQTAYGRHRHRLETELAAQFPRVLAVRLPGLFGTGLKKNAVFDLLYDNDVQKVNAAAVYQFYNLDRLWADVTTALAAGLTVVNFGTEPVSVREVAMAAFDREFTNDPGTPPARFDMRTKHATLFGGSDGYLAGKAAVLAELRAFVARERAGGVA
ncbi:MAG: pyridine nucleotide transhydrogenase [Fimbriiglobus sp.]